MKIVPGMTCLCGLGALAHQHREGSDYPDAHQLEPAVTLHAVPSTVMPESLSVRVDLADRTGTRFHEALTNAFSAGDVLVLHRKLTAARLREIAERHAEAFLRSEGDEDQETYQQTWTVILGALREIAGG